MRRVLGIVAVVAAAATSAGCWWQPGGNANRSGHDGVESVIGLESAPALTEVWTAPGRTSTPGAVWAAAEDGVVAAHPTGGCGTAVCDPVWQVDLGAGFTAPPAIGSGRLFATVDGTMHVFAPSPD